MKETELYKPIEAHFLEMGYSVQAEVKNCDIACVLNNKLTIIEMKKSFNLKVLYQAMDRKPLANFVYIAIQRPKNFRKKEVKHMINILKKLEIGLITISLDSPLKNVDIIYNPEEKPTRKTRRRTMVLNELERRNLNTNIGGSTKKDEILTAYREQVIFIACILELLEQSSPSNIKNKFGIDGAGYILRQNHYGYFEKVSRGVYILSETGKAFLNSKNFVKAVDYYREEAKNVWNREK